MKSKKHSVEERYLMQRMMEAHDANKKRLVWRVLALYFLYFAFIVGAVVMESK